MCKNAKLQKKYSLTFKKDQIESYYHADFFLFELWSVSQLRDD